MYDTKLTFWGGVGAVTGANFLVETKKSKFLVDCGLLQGVSGSDKINRSDFPYDTKSVDFVFITHSHMDHIGRLPKLVRDGFAGIIYSTKETKEMAGVMFVHSKKAEFDN
jgi:metallo-beta-lactamase family protein